MKRLTRRDVSGKRLTVANVVAIEPNRWFATVADLARYIADNRRKNDI